MRNFLLITLLTLIAFSGTNCIKGKTCTPKTPANEASQIQAYALANGINATAHSTGLYYEILNPGTGATATLNSKIVITYTGKLLGGTVFDSRNVPNNSATPGPDAPWPLGELIEGWRVGIPLIKAGGSIRLLIPSAMAYGCNGYGTIPGDAILDFEINLVDVVP